MKAFEFAFNPAKFSKKKTLWSIIDTQLDYSQSVIMELGSLGMEGFSVFGAQGAVVYVVKLHNEKQELDACLYRLYRCKYVLGCDMYQMTYHRLLQHDQLITLFPLEHTKTLLIALQYIFTGRIQKPHGGGGGNPSHFSLLILCCLEKSLKNLSSKIVYEFRKKIQEVLQISWVVIGAKMFSSW